MKNEVKKDKQAATRPLKRHLIVVLTIKVIFLLAIWFSFIKGLSVSVDSQIMARHFFYR